MSFSEIMNTLNFTTIFWQVIATLFFMLGDIIVGFVGALIRKDLDSQKMREGLLRKIVLIVVIVLSFIIQYAFFNMEIISKAVCIYIIFMEVISIIENLQKAGIDFGNFGELFKIKKEDK